MLLIDGHNLIGRTPGFSLSDEEGGREGVLRRISAAKGNTARVVVFFDGDRPGAAREERFGGVRVVYSGAGRSADDEILRRLQTGNPRGDTVVTSDGALARRAKALGARIETCEAFWGRLERRPSSSPSEKPEPAADEAERWLEEFKRRP